MSGAPTPPSRGAAISCQLGSAACWYASEAADSNVTDHTGAHADPDSRLRRSEGLPRCRR